MAPTVIKCTKSCQNKYKGKFCNCWQAKRYWADLRKPVSGEAQVKEGDECEWYVALPSNEM